MLGLGLLQTIAFPSISADTEHGLAVGPIGAECQSVGACIYCLRRPLI